MAAPNFRITKQRMRNHFHYFWWQYLILVLVAIFGWNLVFTMTRYRPPEEKKVIINMYVDGSQEAMNAYMAGVNETLLPEMEEMVAQYTIPDATYGDMVFSTHIAAGEGDIFLVSMDYFQRYASGGVFKVLEDDAELMAIVEESGIDMTKGWRTETETAQKHIYGIPASQLPGLKQYVLLPDDCMVTVAINNGNDENVMIFLRQFVKDMLQEPPEGYAIPADYLIY